MNRGTRGERPQQRLRKWQGRCGGAPHAGCGGMRARAIRGNAINVGGGKRKRRPRATLGSIPSPDMKQLSQRPHIKRAYCRNMCSRDIACEDVGGITAFLQRKIYSRVLLRDGKQADGTFFRIMSGPPTLRRNPISAFSVGRHALGAAACTIPGCPEQPRGRCSLASGE